MVLITLANKPFELKIAPPDSARRRKYFIDLVNETTPTVSLTKGEQGILEALGIDLAVQRRLAPHFADFFDALPSCQSGAELYLSKRCEIPYFVLWSTLFEAQTELERRVKENKATNPSRPGVIMAQDHEVISGFKPRTPEKTDIDYIFTLIRKGSNNHKDIPIPDETNEYVRVFTLRMTEGDEEEEGVDEEKEEEESVGVREDEKEEEESVGVKEGEKEEEESVGVKEGEKEEEEKESVGVKEEEESVGEEKEKEEEESVGEEKDEKDEKEKGGSEERMYGHNPVVINSSTFVLPEGANTLEDINAFLQNTFSGEGTLPFVDPPLESAYGELAGGHRLRTSGNENDCLIHSFLSVTCPHFRAMTAMGRNAFASWFRRTHLPAYLAKRKQVLGFKEEIPDLSGKGFLDARLLTILALVYAVNILMVEPPRDLQKNVLMTLYGNKGDNPTYVLYGNDTHFEPVQLADGTFTIPFDRAERLSSAAAQQLPQMTNKELQQERTRQTDTQFNTNTKKAIAASLLPVQP